MMTRYDTVKYVKWTRICFLNEKKHQMLSVWVAWAQWKFYSAFVILVAGYCSIRSLFGLISCTVCPIPSVDIVLASVVVVVSVVIVIIYLFYVIVNEFTPVLTIAVSGADCLPLKSRHINSFENAATHLLPPFDECHFSFFIIINGVDGCVCVSISLDKMDNTSHSMCSMDSLRTSSIHSAKKEMWLMCERGTHLCIGEV